MRLLREDFKSNKLSVLRSARDWDGIVPKSIKGQFWGRFFTQSLGNQLCDGQLKKRETPQNSHVMQQAISEFPQASVSKRG